ncbi:hypothetical protein DSO57_1019482 [Entomophthora muscae]|uniref:Uncharacterized protein n=1 Tax=Entomophthora muscae TaxID=34485 RepID=A0ACC2T478_9FUNG|nr:hypothetical protein DSO57_1019482 [Entomophthora muscae]
MHIKFCRLKSSRKGRHLNKGLKNTTVKSYTTQYTYPFLRRSLPMHRVGLCVNHDGRRLTWQSGLNKDVKKLTRGSYHPSRYPPLPTPKYNC